MREASVKRTSPSRCGRTDRGLRRLRRSLRGRRPTLQPGDAIHPVRGGQMRRSKEAKSSCRNQRETTDAVRPFDGCSKCYSEAVYMLDKQTRGAILLLRSKGHSLSCISRLLSLSRNSSVPTFVRQV